MVNSRRYTLSDRVAISKVVREKGLAAAIQILADLARERGDEYGQDLAEGLEMLIEGSDSE